MAKRLLQLSWALPIGALLMTIVLFSASNSQGNLTVGENPETGRPTYQLTTAQKVRTSAAAASGLFMGFALGWYAGGRLWSVVRRAGMDGQVGRPVRAVRLFVAAACGVLGMAAIFWPAITTAALITGGNSPEGATGRVPDLLSMLNFVAWITAGTAVGASIGWLTVSSLAKTMGSLRGARTTSVAG